MSDAMTPSRLYHNPRCSKSREALALLQARGVAFETVLYLENAPDQATLAALLEQLGLTARQLMRTGEDEYTRLGLADPGLDDAALLDALAAHPPLIERPIFAHRGRAVIGRPPERVLELL